MKDKDKTGAARTITGKHRAVVRETEHGIPFISFELSGPSLIPGVRKAEIGMILKKGIDHEKAQKFADTMNAEMVGLFITNF